MPSVAKKTVVKKVAPKKAAAKKTPTKRGETLRSKVFKLLANKPEGMTGKEIVDKFSLGGVPAFLKDEGLCDKPRIQRVVRDETTRGVCYKLTALGAKHVKDGQVDEHAAPRSAGREWPNDR